MFLMWSAGNKIVEVAVEETHKLSTTAATCTLDSSYSMAQCHEEKRIEYKIKTAGCYFTGITGYHQQWVSLYPECNTTSSYHKFMDVHRKLLLKESHIIELRNMKKECANRCHTRQYITKEDTDIESIVEGYSIFTVQVSSEGMTYRRVTEKEAMTLEMIVADVGGILGLFLGLSFLSVIAAVRYILRYVVDLMTKRRNFPFTWK